jgi:2,5-diamino-6-(ribosylamino)-4(3H)-pyrimidinone 5'-phosphate reductase
MVGVGTAKADNPGLNTRYSEDGRDIVGMERQPRPLILDPSGRWRNEDTPKLFSLAENGEGKAPWWIVGLGEEMLNKDLVERIEGHRGGVIDAGRYKNRDEGADWDVVLRNMAKTGIRSVMIEGGGTVRDLFPIAFQPLERPYFDCWARLSNLIR